MSVNLFLALCILGIDFMIYALFQWTYGDKRRAIARRVAAQRNSLKEQSPRPLLVTMQRPHSATNSIRMQRKGYNVPTKVA